MKIACDCTRCREYHKKIIGMTDVNSLNTETRVKAELAIKLREAVLGEATINGMVLQSRVIDIINEVTK